MALPTTIRTGVNLWMGSATVDPAVMQTMATRYEFFILQSGFEVMETPPYGGSVSFAAYRQLAIDLKAIRPSLKTCYFAGSIATPDVRFPPYSWLLDADMIHRLDGTLVELLVTDPPPYGPRVMRTVNFGSAATRARLIARWIDWLDQNEMDGILFDIVNPVAIAGFYAALGCPTGALEGAVHTSYYWASNLMTFLAELTAALPTGSLVFINGLDAPGSGTELSPFDPTNPTHALLGEESTRLSIWATGALSEASFIIYLSSADLANYVAMAARVSALGGSVIWFQQPVLFDFYYGSHPANLHPYVPSMDRFYLAAYLLIADARQFYGYHPFAPYQGIDDLGHQFVFDGGADWDLDLGEAWSGVSWDTTGPGAVAVREYEHAYVAVNADTSAGMFTVRGRYRDWHPTTGTACVVSSDTPYLLVPPKTGLCLFKQPAQDWGD